MGGADRSGVVRVKTPAPIARRKLDRMAAPMVGGLSWYPKKPRPALLMGSLRCRRQRTWDELCCGVHLLAVGRQMAAIIRSRGGIWSGCLQEEVEDEEEIGVHMARGSAWDGAENPWTQEGKAL